MSEKRRDWAIIALCLGTLVVMIIYMVVMSTVNSEDVVEEFQLQEPIELIHHKTSEAMKAEGFMGGMFFFGTGHVSGSYRAGSVTDIEFYWAIPSTEEIIASRLPVTKVRFIIDESATTPRVLFVFVDSWQNANLADVNSDSNPNDYFAQGLLYAKVFVSQRVFDAEIAHKLAK